MIGLKLLRFFLPPFHPLKYRYINWYYGKQNGGYFIGDQKYNSTLLETDGWNDELEKRKQKQSI